MKLKMGKMKMFGLCLCLAAITAVAASSPRTTIPLDTNWHFIYAEGSNNWAEIGHDDSGWETVSLPHTWNAFDGQDGGGDYRRGTGWYRTHFTLPTDAAGQRVLVEFDAADKVADVFVNGKSVGTHTGAFARFRFDITDAVHLSGDNVLAVRVNNAASQIIPITGDFTQFGGLYRTARILLTAPVHIATLEHASSGVYLTQRTVTSDKAQVDARVELASEATEPFAGTVRVRVQDAAGQTATVTDVKVKLGVGEKSEVTLPLTITQPHRWNGSLDPYLYHATVELLAGDRVVDSVVQPLGLRAIKITADQGLFLNGEHVFLHGVCRHQDRPDKGWAISPADQTEDFHIIQEMGANAIRLSHYQHNQFFYNLCDAGGMLVWAEDGFVNEAPKGDVARDNAKEQLRELIRQNYNHPSIFCWSIGNETTGKGNDAAAKSSLELLMQLAAEVKAEDPEWPSVYASHHGVDDPRNFVTDLIAFNKYFGWYGGNYDGLGKFLDQFHETHPTVPMGISEYGAGASIYQHEANPPVRNHQAKGPWHPEEWQTAYHEANWLQIKARPWLWGTFIWNMFDFSNDSRAEGDQFGRNDKGLVTYDRQTRKDAFYWYQANWTTNAMVHIVSKRFWERSQPKIEVKVYSNCDAVELKLNGVSVGKTNATDCRFIWPNVELKSGPNRVEAYAYRDGKMVAGDWGGWTYRADGEPLPYKALAAEDAAAATKK
jgi:beta-galactosidase